MKIDYFIDNYADLTPDGLVTTRALHRRYLEALPSGCRALPHCQFVRNVSQVLGLNSHVHWIDGRSQRGFRGIKLKDSSNPINACPRSGEPTVFGLPVSVYQFISKHLQHHLKAKTSSEAIYSSYLEWAKGRQIPKSQLMQYLKDFFKSLNSVQYGVHWIDGRSQRGFRGIKLLAQNAQEV